MSGLIRAKGGTAVMSRRAPEVVAADTELESLHRRLDYFPTPPWAARAGAELVLSLDPAARRVWEPACGEGHMAAALSEYFEVVATDVHAHGYGEIADFLGDVSFPGVDWIVTNPPFKIAEQFVALGLERARSGVALLLRLPFLEGQRRHSLLYGERPLTLLAPCTERVPMSLGRWDPALSTATAYAWFVWEKRAAGPAIIRPIPPGTRDRLWKVDDARRFGSVVQSPMLDAMEAVA